MNLKKTTKYVEARFFGAKNAPQNDNEERKQKRYAKTREGRPEFSDPASRLRDGSGG
jgi:hypothetical protein